MIEQFARQVKPVQDKLGKQLKTSKVKSFELYETTCLPNVMVFGFENKSISKIDTLFFALQDGLFITLNP